MESPWIFGARAEAEREANARAAARGEPLPFPSIWDQADPTKVEPGADAEAIAASYQEFTRRCPRPTPKRLQR